jgi:penicillin-binding protein 1C
LKAKAKPRSHRLLFAAALCVGILITGHLVLRALPFPELKAYRQERSWGMVITDRNGAALRVMPAQDGVKREWADLTEFPAAAIKVFIRAEDRRFYLHPGVDPIAIVRSFLRNMRAGRTVSGASTITMQLARLLRPHGGGLGGKLREAWDSLRLEAKLSKKEILELWLNSIPFGSNIEGLPAITRARFGRSIAQLDDNRAALLAVVPRRPGLYDPALNPQAAVAAALALSERAGLNLREAELRAAAAEAASTDIGSIDPSLKAPFFAPHFTERIATTLGGSGAPRRVRSTLDLKLQRYAEDQLNLELAMLSTNRVSNGAILAIDNETGAVRIYAGSASWFDDEAFGKIDGIRSRAQPGSCLKPFLYAMALDAGLSPAEIMPDLPTVFGGREAYIPSNFNQRFNGPVRFRIALASSLNIPAVYLLERLGVQAFEEYLVKLGFDSIAERMGTHGTGLALGNAEVSLEEMVRGFSAFPRQGLPAELRWIEEAGEAGRGEAQQIMSSYAAWIIGDILSDKSSRFIGFGPAPTLATPFPAMFKTGTANQYQHIWALGATARFTVGVWMGNFSGETVIGRTGSSIPARIAAHILTAMETAEDGTAANIGSPPPGITEVEICSLSGMAAGPSCTGTAREWLRTEQVPPRCSWHSDGGLFYPPEYQAWLAERFHTGQTRQQGEGGRGTGFIRLPPEGSVFYLDPSLPREAQALRLETAGFGPNALVYTDGNLEGSLNYAGVYALPLSKGRHTALVEDESGASASVSFEVR